MDIPPPRRPTRGLSLVTSTVIVYGALVLVAVGWGLVDGFRNIYFVPGRGPGPDSLWSGLAGLGLGVAAVLLSRLIVARLAWARQLHMEFHVVLRGLNAWQALVIALASAVGEEALFRGAMVPSLGIWLSSIVFGMVHVPVRRGLWPWPLLAFLLGLAFGGIFLRFGDLTGPIIAHFVINFINLKHIARTAYPDALPPVPQPPAAGPPGQSEAGPPPQPPRSAAAVPEEPEAPLGQAGADEPGSDR